MTEDIASAARRIVELGEKATPGPWRRARNSRRTRFVERIYGNGLIAQLEARDATAANADLILAARNDAPALASAYLQAVEILQGFLGCPEIADCAPEDKDPETDALERRARRLITGEQSHG